MKHIIYPFTAVILFLVVLLGFSVYQKERQNTLSPEIQQAIQDYVDSSLQAPLVGATLPIAGQTYTLSGAGVSQSATSITLSSLTVTQTGQKIQDSDLSTTFYLTLEPGNKSKQEIVSCTTVVQNANGSATLSGCTRGLSPITPYTASTTLRFSHGGGTPVIFSNPPQFYNEFLQLQNAATSSAVLVVGSTTPWRYDYNPDFLSLASTTFASIGYVASTSYNGTVDANDSTKGIVEMATGAEGAAGTSLGGTGARLALGSNLGTSTCQALANSVVFTLLSTGKLSSGCIDQTLLYTWTGHHIFSSLFATNASTTNATTTNMYVSGTFDVASGGPTATSTVFTSSGTWVKPTSISKVKVTVVGGGGAGGGASDSGADAAGGGGGGGGCAVAEVSVTGNVTVTVGTGGAGVQGAAGGNGATSTFAAVTSIHGIGGTGGSNGSSGNGGGGAGGGTTNANWGVPGRAGQSAITIGAAKLAGHGGDSCRGYGAFGVSADGNGAAASAYGGGGAGAVDTADNGAALTGGNGTDGIVIVEWYEY